MYLVPEQVLDRFLPSYPAVSAVDREAILADTATLIRSHIRQASFLVQGGLLALALVFRVWMLLAHVLGWDPDLAMGRWITLTGDPGRSFLRLARSLAVFSYLEHPLVLRRMGLRQVPEQQAHFRQKRLKTAKAGAS